MSKKHIYGILIMLILSFIFILSLPKKATQKKTLQIFDVFNTYSEITVISKNPEEALLKCNQYLHEKDELWSFTKPSSEISLLNSSKENFVTLSEDTMDILKKSIDVSVYTDGFFDVTVGAITELWDFNSNSPKIPDEDEISKALSKTGYKFLKIDEKNHKAFIDKKGAKVNLGGIAKGYAADALRNILTNHGISSALINLGGNIYAMGRQENNLPWSVGIQDPGNEDSLICTLEVSDTSVVTSGNYQRYFEIDSVRYHHIMNPFTGKSANSGLSSVTIISPNSTLADVLSTACFIMGYPESLPIIKNSGAFAIFVTDENIVYYSCELEEIIEYDNPMYEYKKIEY